MSVSSYLTPKYYAELEELRFELRRANRRINYLNNRLDQAHAVMKKEKVGMYKYTETSVERFEKRLALASANLQLQADFAVRRIKNFAGVDDV